MDPIIEMNPDASAGSYDITQKRRPYVSRAEDFLAGRSNPRDLLEEQLARIEGDNEVRAFCFVDVEASRKAADESAKRWAEGRPLSELDGCAVGLKDTIDVRGMPSKQNSKIFDETPKLYDAACVHALRRAGAIPVGKTWVPELAMGALPPTRNPYDLRRTAGGSSSGSGAAVGADMVAVAIGNQTGGSLIRPASFNANYGFKPSHGALNVAGMHPLAPSQDHIGPMAGTLADAWATAWEVSTRAGGHDGNPGFGGRVALPTPLKPGRLCRLNTSGWTELDDASRRAFERLVDGLKTAGVSILDENSDDDVAYLEELLLEADSISNDIIMYEVRWPLVSYIETHGHDILSEAAHHRLTRGLEMSPADYRRALQRRDQIRKQVERISAGVDGFLTLASSGPAPFFEAPPDAAVGAGHHLRTGSRAYLSPWSMTGGPSLSLPLMSVDGMPLGAQLMGVRGQDRRVVAIAAWLDQGGAG